MIVIIKKKLFQLQLTLTYLSMTKLVIFRRSNRQDDRPDLADECISPIALDRDIILVLIHGLIKICFLAKWFMSQT
jgi:hypothetical protein